MGGELGEEWIHVYIRLSPFTVHLKLTTLLISYIPIQNKKFKQKKREKEGSSQTLLGALLL